MSNESVSSNQYSLLRAIARRYLLLRSKIEGIGYRIQDIGYGIQDIVYRIQYIVYRIQDIGYRIQDIVYRIQPSIFNLRRILGIASYRDRRSRSSMFISSSCRSQRILGIASYRDRRSRSQIFKGDRRNRFLSKIEDRDHLYAI